MQSKQDKEKIKQPYEKPRLRTIELSAEEVLAVGCKMLGGQDLTSGFPNCGIDNNCSQVGS